MEGSVLIVMLTPIFMPGIVLYMPNLLFSP